MTIGALSSYCAFLSVDRLILLFSTILHHNYYFHMPTKRKHIHAYAVLWKREELDGLQIRRRSMMRVPNGCQDKKVYWHIITMHRIIRKHFVNPPFCILADKLSQKNTSKPLIKTYLEMGLPESLRKALGEYIQGEKEQVSHMDCLWGELQCP